MSWIDKRRGFAIAEKKAKEIAEKRKNYVPRFWLPPGGEAKIIFLDGSNPPVFDEHQLKINGDWRNWFTCNSIFGEECPYCLSGHSPSTTGFFTVIDLTEFTDKKGKLRKNEKRLYTAKVSVLQMLERYDRKKGGLAGWVVEVSRGTADSPSSGNCFDFVEKVTKSDIEKLIGKETADPFPYADILVPLSQEAASIKLSQVTEEVTKFSGEKIEADSIKVDDVEF